MNPTINRKKLFEQVSVQFQESHYQENIKVGELCEVTASLYKKPSDYKKLLTKFNITDKINTFVKELSGGEKQRLFIVLALIPSPQVVFLDELTTGLDARARRDVWQVLAKLKADGLTICAGGVMGLPLVVSDYRSKQILKRFKVTPISPVTILLAEVTIYFIYALISLITLFAVAIIFFDFKMQGSILQFILGWFLVMVSIFSIGMMVGGIAKNSKVAGIIASILYFPMLIFSGATLPYEVMPVAMQSVVDILPLTQGIKILKSATLNLPMDSVLLPIIVMIAIAVICSFVAIKYFKWE